jgi:predicted site-specific integrase-resolvase
MYMSGWVMPKEAAKIIGVSVQTLRAWDKAGRIPTKRSGGNTVPRREKATVGRQSKFSVKRKQYHHGSNS